MGIKEYLDSCLNKYYIGMLKSNGFELVDSNISGMGGIYYFKSDWLNFSILNDRGIIETRISSLYSKKEFDFDIINAFFVRNTGLTIDDKKFGKSDLSKRLNLEQESQLFESSIDTLKTMFNEQNYNQTELELHKYEKERAKLIFK